MATAVDQVVIPLVTVDGRTLAELRVAAPAARASQPPLLILDAAEVQEWHERPVQLLEGLSYDFEFIPPAAGSRLRGGAVRRSPLSAPNLERGRIEPGVDTGVLDLVLEDAAGIAIARALIEVRSAKLGYRSQYRRMLADIAERTIELLIDLRAPSGAWLKPDSEQSPGSLVQRFFFVKHLLTSPEFRGAIAQIAERPHETTVANRVESPVARGIRGGADLTRHLCRPAGRVSIPSGHPLAERLSSLPRRLEIQQSAPSRNTAENRFVRFVLRDFASFVTHVEAVVRAQDAERDAPVLAECRGLRSEISRHLARSPFRDIDDPLHSLPLGSPVLQRRAGYREVLRAWIQFGLAAQLSWEGAADVFLAGKRDVAQLYEFWTFFRILEVAQLKLGLQREALRSLFKYDEGRFALSLKSGRSMDLSGLWTRDGRELQVRVSYNRTFIRSSNPVGDPERSFPNAGSWTRPMRPDYTISFWPPGITEAEAEDRDRIVHLHFDAKYRVEALTELFGGGNVEEADAEALSVVLGGAKRGDLLKMHAYRDAIRRSVSAFVLYPGSESRRWRSMTEIIPGLGAIALVPGDDTGVRLLEAFFEDAAEFAHGRLMS